MERDIYFDILDPDRTKLGRASEDSRRAYAKRADENIFRGQAELKMAILCGATPVLPQTYGWDSSALLDYGGEERSEGAGFMWLLRKGYIRIRLRNQESVWDAALAGFDNPAFTYLAAWPEFNTDNPYEARRPLVETMRNWQPRLSRTRKCSEALPDEVCHRLEVLAELSDAAKEAQAKDPQINQLELPRKERLSRLINLASEAAKHLDPKVGSLLSRCTSEVPDPNNRSAIDAFLARENEKVGEMPPEVREITNGCYNAVAAECLRARAALTLPVSLPLAAEVLQQTFPGSMRSDLCETKIEHPETISELKAFGWYDLHRFLQECSELKLTDMQREAEAARFIATAAVKNVTRYVMMANRSNMLRNAAIWGPLTAVGTVVAYGVAGPYAAIVATVASGLAGSAAGFLGATDFRGHKVTQIHQVLEKKWLGLLQGTKSQVQSDERAR